MKIEAGRYYQTKQGEWVGPMLQAFGSCGMRFSNGGIFDDPRIWDNYGCCTDPDARIQDSVSQADLSGEIALAEATLQADLAQSTNKYKRAVPSLEIDIYDVIVAWGITCPARQHALKKIMCAGERGVKGVEQDLDEAIQALERAKELVG